MERSESSTQRHERRTQRNETNARAERAQRSETNADDDAGTWDALPLTAAARLAAARLAVRRAARFGSSLSVLDFLP